MTFSLIDSLLKTRGYQFGTGESFLIAGMINLYATGVLAMLGFIFPTHKVLPNNFYKIQNTGFLTSVYKTLGVSYFRFLLLLFFWGNKKNRKKYFDGTRSGLMNFIYQSKQSEFGHLAAFCSIFLISIVPLLKGFWAIFGFITLINFIGNFYPIILQRYHRIRIGKILD